jgi:hypothetical protein
MIEFPRYDMQTTFRVYNANDKSAHPTIISPLPRHSHFDLVFSTAASELVKVSPANMGLSPARPLVVLVMRQNLYVAISRIDISPTMIPELRRTDEWNSPRGRTAGDRWDRWRNNSPSEMRRLPMKARLTSIKTTRRSNLIPNSMSIITRKKYLTQFP